MATSIRPPLGVMPLRKWKQQFRDAGRNVTVIERVRRWEAVHAAIERYRSAGKRVPQCWLDEVRDG